MKYFCNFECGIILHEKADVQSFISLVLNTHKFEYHDEEFITHSLLFSHVGIRKKIKANTWSEPFRK